MHKAIKLRNNLYVLSSPNPLQLSESIVLDYLRRAMANPGLQNIPPAPNAFFNHNLRAPRITRSHNNYIPPLNVQFRVGPNEELLATLPVQAPLGALTLGRWSKTPNAPPTLRINAMHKLPCRTGTSKTGVSAMVEALPVKDQLHTIRKSSELWKNLVNYAIERHPTATRPNTFSMNASVADVENQVKSVYAMHGWYQWQQQVTSHLVNSEADIQDVLYTELIMYANESLKVSLHLITDTVLHTNLSR